MSARCCRARYGSRPIEAEGLLVRLDEQPAGNDNFTFSAGDGEDTTLPVIDIGDVSLTKGEVRYHHRGGADVVQLRIFEAEGAFPAKGVSSVDGVGSWFGGGLEARITSADLTQILAKQQAVPIAARASWDGLEASAQGSIDDLFGFEGLRVEAELEGEAFHALGARFDVDWPEFGAYSAAARVSWIQRTLGIQGDARVGRNDLDLDLALRFDDPLQVRGRVDAGVLDLGVLVPEAADPQEEGLELPFAVLTGLDADLEFRAAGLVEPAVDDAFSGRVQAGDGLFQVEATLPLTGEVLSARFFVDGRSVPPEVGLDANAPRFPAADLSYALDLPDIADGDLREVNLVLRAEGETRDEVLRTARGQLGVAGGSLRFRPDEGEPVVAEVGALEVRALPGGTLEGTLAVVLEEIAIAAELDFQGRRDGLGAPADLVLRVRSEAVTADARGELLADPLRLSATFDATARELGGLSPWLGVPEAIRVPVSLRGEFVLEDGHWELGLDEARLGTTGLRARIGESGEDGKGEITARVEVDRVDLGGLVSALASDEIELREPGEGVVVDFPLLAGDLELGDAEIDLRIDQVVDELDISDLAITGKVAAGRLLRGRIEGRVEGTFFEGEIEAVLDGVEPTLSIEARAGAFDLGRFARALGVANDLELRTEGLAIDFFAKGSDDERLAETANLRAALDGATWTLRDPVSDASLDLHLSGRLEAEPGGPLRVSAEGETVDLPIGLELSTAPLVAFVRRSDVIPIDLVLDRGYGSLELKGTGTLPLATSDLDGEVVWTGKSLADWRLIPGLELPALGPFQVRTDVRATANGFDFRGLELALGESDLAGDLKLLTDRSPPRLEGSLVSKTLRLEDLRTIDPAPAEPAEDELAEPEPKRGRAVIKKKVDPLRDPEVFGGAEGEISLDVESITFQDRRLGGGQIRGQLGEGRLALAPIEVALPGGRLFGAFYWAPTADTTDWELLLETPRIDYTPIAQLLQPGTEARGRLTVLANLSASDPIDHVLGGTANGRFGLAIWPEDLAATAVDFWALNLLLAVIPALNIVESSVNCLVGRFDVRSGVARPDPLLLDTTTTRIHATGKLDFDRERVNLLLDPVPKIRQVWSLATPLQIKGDFSDFGARVRPESLVGTAFEFYTSPVTAPLSWILSRKPPADGSDVCDDPFTGWDVGAAPEARER